MASVSGKKEKFTILEEIYHDDKSPKKSKGLFREVRGYFRNEKLVNNLLAALILFFGLAAIVLGFFQFRYQINKDIFARFQPTAAVSGPEDLLGLKEKDTDQDGLSNYDELYLYGSSPYIQDTDSDGINDQKEVAAGGDPTCPEGQNCFAFWNPETPQNAAADNSSLSTGQISSVQLRQTLKQAGMTDEELAQFSDEDLLQLYQQALAGMQSGNTQAETSAVTPAVANPADLTPAQIRQYLKEAGVASSLLDQVTDDELMDLAAETLKTQNPPTVPDASNTQ